jgi:TetR/AcrR family transcriptional regulator, tetracycline repressor protein
LLAKIEPEEIFRIGLKILLDGTDCRAKEIARAKKVVRRPL